jgi:hypothetical protein
MDTTHAKDSDLNEQSRIARVIESHIDELLQKRKEVESKVQSELDDIDRALRQLGYEGNGGHSGSSARRKRRTKISDAEIKSLLNGFMNHGVYISGAEILKKTSLKASRFANFKAANKGFLVTQGAKRAMTYSLA